MTIDITDGTAVSSSKTKVFPALRVVVAERKFDPSTGGMTEWANVEEYFVVDDDADDYIDKMLGDRFGITPLFLMKLTRDLSAWAVVFFTNIIENSDKVLEVRGELREQILFTAYGKLEPSKPNPPLGVMIVKRKEALRVASARHEVFRQAWGALQNSAPDANWVAVVDLRAAYEADE